MKRVGLAILASLFTISAHAQTPPQLSRGNGGTVGIITGMEGGTYARTGADLTILDDDSIRVLPTIGKGSLQNLSDILFLKGIDIGFCQADALAYAKQHNMFPGLTQNIRYIAKLYDEEVHVLARKDITKIADLNGQRINADVIGSGSSVTADILLDALGIKATVEHDKQINAIQKLKNGEIAAIIHVGGAPIPFFSDVTSDSGLHLLAVPMNETLMANYMPDKFVHAQYPALIGDGEDQSIPTLAVGDVLAVFNWPSKSTRATNINRFVADFFSKFDEFQKPPRHPKWKEVNLTAEVPGWVRYQPAQDWLDHQNKQIVNPMTRARFDMFLAQSRPNTPMSDADRDKLFKDFLSWHGGNQ